MKPGCNFLTWALALAACAASHAAVAAGPEIPVSETPLDGLRREAAADPRNLDAWYAYANAAASAGKWREAAAALEHMLDLAPSLPRVKLDLGMVYLQTAQPGKARALFAEVMAMNPPEEVKRNIREALDLADRNLKPHSWSGSASTGYNFDTNANASSSSGTVKFLDFILPLPPTAMAQKDGQIFGAASVNHSYRFDTDENERLRNWRWNMVVLGYGTEQIKLDNLNLYLMSVKTGPSVDLPDWNLRLGANAGLQYVMLDGYEYLTQPTAEVYGSYTATPRLQFNWVLSAEDRNFENAPAVTVFSDRSGHALQARAGFSYALTPSDLVSFSLFLREESTRQEYYDNLQRGVIAGYTRLLPDDWFLTANASYRMSDYDAADFFVSSTVREDHERIIGAGVGKQLTKTVSWFAGYTYTDVNSNIPNYAYENRRVSTSININF